MDKVRFVWQLLSTNQKENIVKELQRKHVYIFGGGEFGTALCSLLSLEKIRVQCIFDNAEAKWGLKIDEVPIVKFEENIIEDDYIVLIAAGVYETEIKKQLLACCINNIIGFEEYFLQENKLEILEIGPLNNPLFRGNNVKYFDVLPVDELIEKTLSWGLDPAGVPEKIDYVSECADLGIIKDKFQVVFSSNCIEHQPDLVKHLMDVENILEAGGKYYLVIPDKRYCFDYYNRQSDWCDVVAAHFEKRRVHSLRSLFAIENRTHNNAKEHWAGNHGEAPSVNPDNIGNLIREYNEGKYIDTHAWYFTPESFKEIMERLNEMGLVNLKLANVYETEKDSCNFFAILEKK